MDASAKVKKAAKNLVANQVSHILEIIHVWNQDHHSIKINGVVELIWQSPTQLQYYDR